MKNIQERIKVLEQTLSDVPEHPNTDKDVFTLDQEIAALTQSKEMITYHGRLLYMKREVNARGFSTFLY